MTFSTKKQPNPKFNHNRPAIADLVIEDLRRLNLDELIPEVQARKAMGFITYGFPLQPHNGRNAAEDAFQEAIDLVKYLRQCIEEGQDGCLRDYKASIQLAHNIFVRLNQTNLTK